MVLTPYMQPASAGRKITETIMGRLYFIVHGMGGFGAGAEEFGSAFERVMITVCRYAGFSFDSRLTSITSLDLSAHHPNERATINVTRNRSRMANFMERMDDKE